MLHSKNFLVSYYFSVSLIFNITLFVHWYYNKFYLDNVSGMQPNICKIYTLQNWPPKLVYQQDLEKISLCVDMKINCWVFGMTVVSY